MKKMDNKGFSLVELIVVVAIMAVLMTVLAPQYLKYVEKARLQKDNSAIAEIANAIKIAMADETINSAVTDGTTITFANSAGDDATVTFSANVMLPGGTTVCGKLADELTDVMGASCKTSSNTYNESSTPIVITINKTGSSVSVSATGFIESVGGAPTGTTPAGGTAVPAKTF